VYRVLMVKPEGKDLLEDQGVDGIKMDLRDIGWGRGVGVNSPGSGQGRCWAVVNAVMNLRVLAPRS
jgi:hypothetical protein